MIRMTQEQREHIATTIAILDMASAILKDLDSNRAGEVVGAQCEILQEVLEADGRDTPWE